MSVSARQTPAQAGERSPLDELLEALELRPATQLASHPSACCVRARQWFSALSRSAHLHQPGPPTWIRERWEWGPTRWPLHWCEAADLEAIDCGALAALARAAFEARGDRAFAVQLVERHDDDATENWQRVWHEHLGACDWIWGDLVYHEAVGVVAGESLRLWDPTDNRWVSGKQTSETGSIAAVRIPGLRDDISWDGITLGRRSWQRIKVYRSA